MCQVKSSSGEGTKSSTYLSRNALPRVSQSARLNGFEIPTRRVDTVSTKHLGHQHQSLRLDRSSGSKSHSRAVPSRHAVSTRCPSGLNWARTRCLSPCLSGPVNGSPVAVSQTRAVPSRHAVATRRSSGLNDACRTLEGCHPSDGVSGLPVAASQTRAVLSSLVVTTCLPLGLNTP